MPIRRYEITTESLVRRTNVVFASDEEHAMQKFEEGRIVEVWDTSEGEADVLHIEEVK